MAMASRCFPRGLVRWAHARSGCVGGLGGSTAAGRARDNATAAQPEHAPACRRPHRRAPRSRQCDRCSARARLGLSPPPPPRGAVATLRPPLSPSTPRLVAAPTAAGRSRDIATAAQPEHASACRRPHRRAPRSRQCDRCSARARLGLSPPPPPRGAVATLRPPLSPSTPRLVAAPTAAGRSRDIATAAQPEHASACRCEQVDGPSAPEKSTRRYPEHATRRRSRR